MQFKMVRQDINRECRIIHVTEKPICVVGILRKIADKRIVSLLQILFLNKIDLFAEKLPRSPLGDYFPDYTGGDDYDAACNYLLHRFVSLNQSAATKQIYAHYTCATDTQQIKCTCFHLSLYRT